VNLALKVAVQNLNRKKPDALQVSKRYVLIQTTA